MFEKTIGENAGRVWSLLSENGPMSPTAIAKQLNLKNPEVDRALGWLAREEKLAVEKTGRSGLKISLR